MVPPGLTWPALAHRGKRKSDGVAIAFHPGSCLRVATTPAAPPLVFVRLSRERAIQAVLQDCSLAK